MEKDITPNSLKSVFKFYSLTDYNLDAFSNHYLFTSHPYHLNDLMDGNIYSIDLRNISNTQYDILKKQIKQQAPLICNKAIWNYLNPESDPGFIQLQTAIMASFFSFGGIISLTKQNRFNELMWSHYTNESGFMIEFDTNILINSIIKYSRNSHVKKMYFKPIEYKPNPISISCSKYQDIESINIYNATQKNIEWSYEKEWRLILTSSLYMGLPKSIYADSSDCEITNTNNRKVYYDNQAIKNIYLGKKFWEIDNIKKVIPYMGDRNVKIYRVANKIAALISELCNYKERIYMSGVCQCAEFRHGTNTWVYNIRTGQYEFNPNSFYLTRSFEQIKNIDITGLTVIVTCDGIARIKDCDFE